MGCVQPYAVNDLNFLRWHPCAAVVLPFQAPLAYCQPAGPACALYAEASPYAEYPKLPLVDGDQVKFFINSDDAIAIPAGFASLGLGLVQNGVLVVANAGTLASLPGLTPNTFYLRGSLNVNCWLDGVYWPVIYDLNDKHVLLIANPVQVMNLQNWQAETVWVRYRHPSSLYGVNYSALPAFYQEFRLALSMFQPTFPTDETTYTDANNYTRTTKLVVGRTYEIQTDFMDQATFDAAAMMFTHRELFIDGKRVKAQGSLAPEYLPGSIWVTAKGKVLDQDFARRVSQC
jgi:hypothetical protein